MISGLFTLDNYLVMVAPSSEKCRTAMVILLQTGDWLGLSVAVYKLEGPAPCLTFRGVELDSRIMELRLTQGKLAELQTLLQEWQVLQEAPTRVLGRETFTCQQGCTVTVVPTGHGVLSHHIWTDASDLDVQQYTQRPAVGSRSNGRNMETQRQSHCLHQNKRAVVVCAVWNHVEMWGCYCPL